ncbi:MAG: NAD-dependent epimerase/dehydratase family protein [Alphaproteobacteria bacterium]
MGNVENKNVLITGATGGLGLTLVKTFAENGFNVLATGRRESACERIVSYGAKFLKADLTNSTELTQLCDGIDILIHAAALSDSWGKPEAFQNINVTATQDLLKASKNNGVQSFIFISSPSIYAAMKDQYGLTEEHESPSLPLNDYAKTKLEAEKLALAANTETFKTVVIRPRAIVGPDDQVLLPKITEMINRGVLPSLRGGKAMIELTDVRDVAQAVLLAAQNIDKASGQVFNISGGQEILIRELAIKLAECTSRKVRFIPLPMVFAKYLAKKLESKAINEGYKNVPKLTRYTLATLAYSQTFDMSKARNKLGYEPKYDALQTILDIAKERAA